MDALVAEYGEEDVMRWCETGRLVEKVLPALAEGAEEYFGDSAAWLSCEMWPQRGGHSYAIETSTPGMGDPERFSTALAALREAE